MGCMGNHTLRVAMVVLISATLVGAADAGQRQRSPGGHGGGRQEQGGGSNNGESNAGPRATPREDRGGDRSGPRDNGPRDNGRRESTAPPQAQSAPPAETQAPRNEPRARSRVEPRDQARTDTQVQPRAETQVQPRSETRVDAQSQTSTGRTAIRRYPLPSDTPRNEGRTGAGSSTGRVENRTYTNRGSVTPAYDGNRNTGRVAIPRSGPGPQRHDGRYAYGGHSYYSGGRYYTYAPRYYYSARYYDYRPYYFYRPGYYTAFTFGFGPYGRGYFYYDNFYNSYVFYPRTVVGYYGDSGYYGRPTGSLRLDIEPRDAQVYIDGAYAGLVDDFDGVFQSLRLEAGQYHVEVVLPGFESLAFDVYIQPGEKTTYRAEMFAERP